LACRCAIDFVAQIGDASHLSGRCRASAMTFWQGLTFTYRESLAFVVACPLLALVPVLFELIQHIVEVRIGMYDSPELAVATEDHPLRMTFGLLKIMALTVPFYWATRYFAGNRDVAAARSYDRTSLTLFAGVLAFMLAVAALSLFVLPREGAGVIASLLGSLLVSVLAARWFAAAALGNAAIGPLRSAREMLRLLPWAVAFTIAAQLPLMIPHYGFAALAILGPKSLLWPGLVIDSFLVGWLALVIVAANWVVATRPGPVQA
jgi:hypothetical protein